MKKLFFYTIATFVLLTITSGNGYCQAVMTMTTAPKTKEVSFILEGSGKVTIDWGDGKKENSIISIAYSKCNRLIYRYEHTYSNTLAHTITIIGENIEELNCADNQLTNLKVDKNTALDYLNCGGNQLTNLNIDKNTKLTGLSCDNNLLTHLDISKNMALDFLYCYKNQLTSLDVSKNKKLSHLDCSRNNFSEVALNALFKTLHNRIKWKKSIEISKNQGTESCDKSIAKKKGWKVSTKKN